MPRGDRTGPNGMGPMTGRKNGLCAGYDLPGYANNQFGGRRGMGAEGLGYGAGYGGGYGGGCGTRRRRGMGQGRGRQFSSDGYASYYEEDLPNERRNTVNNNIDAIRNEMHKLGALLENLKTRFDALVNSQKNAETKSAGD